MPVAPRVHGTRRVALLVCTAVMFFVSPERTAPLSAAAAPIRFGADVESIDRAAAQGLPLSYATFWVGSWTAKYGWGHAQQALQAAAARNVTPVVHWWYWGDDIGPACVERGCNDPRQGVWKDRTTWTRMSDELSQLIANTIGGREAVVILETEFNKGGIETYEPFDGYLAEQINILRRRGNVKVVLGFGNWGRDHWGRFDRAINAADMLGTQLLRSSVRDLDSYATAVSTLIASTQYLHRTFTKETMVIDLALSSYPSASYEAVQAAVSSELFARIGELKSAGVRGILYRMIVDDPTFDTSNYHGVAERHWGLLRADGSPKPAFAHFVNGLRQDQGDRPAAPGCQPPAAVQGLRFAVSGSTVDLQWQGLDRAASYVIEAGSAAGLANLAVLELVPNALQVAAPPGTYFVRVRGRNSCGTGAPSSEQTITVR